MTDQNRAVNRNRTFINGNIITMDDNDTIVEAVIIRDGQIVKTGTTSDHRQRYSIHNSYGYARYFHETAFTGLVCR